MSRQCYFNIGPHLAHRRMLAGLILLLLTIFIFIVTIMIDFGRGWRLLFLVPFWLAALPFLQAHEKT